MQVTYVENNKRPAFCHKILNSTGKQNKLKWTPSIREKAHNKLQIRNYITNKVPFIIHSCISAHHQPPICNVDIVTDDRNADN